MQPTPPLAGTRWYVPAENLLAYLTDPALRARKAVADQTVWSIATAEGSRFQGTARTRLWTAAPGGFTQLAATTSALDGELGKDGAVTIVFTPEDPDQPPTVGYGRLREVDGEWRMEMQMATGTTALTLHWAYMTPWTADGAPPGIPARALEGSLRSEEWSWLPDTAWSATDRALFPGGASFTIVHYRNGYLWGEGATADATPLRIAGSITPEGSTYLLFSVDGAPAVARRGGMEVSGEGYRMAWSEPAGGPVLGGAVWRGREED
jgi:hypothetical protein